MDWNIIEGKWKELKGRAREQWGKLTDDELEEVGARRTASSASCSRSTDTPPTKPIGVRTSGRSSRMRSNRAMSARPGFRLKG